MQDTQTGLMMPINAENFAELEKAKIQEQKDLVMPDIERQGAILCVGEDTTIKGGDFRVKSIGSEMIIMEAHPGTRVLNGKTFNPDKLNRKRLRQYIMLSIDEPLEVLGAYFKVRSIKPKQLILTGVPKPVKDTGEVEG